MQGKTAYDRSFSGICIGGNFMHGLPLYYQPLKLHNFSLILVFILFLILYFSNLTFFACVSLLTRNKAISFHELKVTCLFSWRLLIQFFKLLGIFVIVENFHSFVEQEVYFSMSLYIWKFFIRVLILIAVLVISITTLFCFLSLQPLEPFSYSSCHWSVYYQTI